MEKYGTYRIFKNEETGETKRVPIKQEFEKKASADKKEKWVEVFKEDETH